MIDALCQKEEEKEEFCFTSSFVSVFFFFAQLKIQCMFYVNIYDHHKTSGSMLWLMPIEKSNPICCGAAALVKKACFLVYRRYTSA